MYPAAATVFNNGIQYMINRSSLCGRKEYIQTKPIAGRRRDNVRLSVKAPQGIMKREKRRERGRAEVKYHQIGDV